MKNNGVAKNMAKNYVVKQKQSHKERNLRTFPSLVLLKLNYWAIFFKAPPRMACNFRLFLHFALILHGAFPLNFIVIGREFFRRAVVGSLHVKSVLSPAFRPWCWLGLIVDSGFRRCELVLFGAFIELCLLHSVSSWFDLRVSGSVFAFRVYGRLKRLTNFDGMLKPNAGSHKRSIKVFRYVHLSIFKRIWFYFLEYELTVLSWNIIKNTLYFGAVFYLRYLLIRFMHQ